MTHEPLTCHLRGVVERRVLLHDPTWTAELEHEMMAMRTELKLEVTLVRTEQEEFDDLVIPKTGRVTDRNIRRIAAVKGGVDVDHEGVTTEREVHSNPVHSRRRLTVPGLGDEQRARFDLHVGRGYRQPGQLE